MKQTNRIKRLLSLALTAAVLLGVVLVLLIAARSDQHAEYLRLLSRLSSKLKDDCFRERLFACSSSAEFYAQLIEK